jgi:hypothetical protein
MDFVTAALTTAASLWDLFKYWLSIFFVFPFKDVEILWILIPVWITLLITDFFQERKGASLGHAITNGAVQMWVGVDWMRFLVRTSKEFSGLLALKFAICLFTTVAGIVIVVQSFKHNRGAQLWGRVRVTSYSMLVLSPIVYNLITPSWSYLLATIIYFPLFYYTLEVLGYFVPELEEENSSFTFPK